MRTIAIINQKGGCGKTTTAINLSAALAAEGMRVLLVDLDPQSHCSLGLAIPDAQIDLHAGDAMLAPDNRPPERSRLVWRAWRGLDLIPSSTRIAALEAARGGLAEREDRDRRLASALSHFHGQYDWCFIDCPPSIGLLTYNALRAADEVLIPVETAYFALQGAARQVNTIQALGRRVGLCTPYRVLPTLHDEHTALAAGVLQELERRLEGSLIPIAIRLDPRLKDAASVGVPIVELDPTSTGAEDYTALARFYGSAPRLEAQVVVQDPPAVITAPDLSPPQPRRVHEQTALRLQDDNPSRIAPGPGFEATEPPVLRESAPSEAADLHGRGPFPVSSRAAELAARARHLALRSAELSAKLESDPRVSRVLHGAHENGSIPLNRADREGAAALAGVRVTSRGVLFLHPAPPGSRVCISGDHNGWSCDATPMRYNHGIGMHEALLSLPPGKFRYKLVVDGRQIRDPYNPLTEPSAFGEPDSVVLVPAADAPRAHSAAIPA